eukprot:gene20919-27115_t
MNLNELDELNDDSTSQLLGLESINKENSLIDEIESDVRVELSHVYNINKLYNVFGSLFGLIRQQQRDIDQLRQTINDKQPEEHEDYDKRISTLEIKLDKLTKRTIGRADSITAVNIDDLVERRHPVARAVGLSIIAENTTNHELFKQSALALTIRGNKTFDRLRDTPLPSSISTPVLSRYNIDNKQNKLFNNFKDEVIADNKIIKRDKEKENNQPNSTVDGITVDGMLVSKSISNSVIVSKSPSIDNETSSQISLSVKSNQSNIPVNVNSNVSDAPINVVDSVDSQLNEQIVYQSNEQLINKSNEQVLSDIKITVPSINTETILSPAFTPKTRDVRVEETKDNKKLTPINVKVRSTPSSPQTTIRLPRPLKDKDIVFGAITRQHSPFNPSFPVIALSNVPSQSKRRKMDVRNLVLSTPTKRERICQELRLRGVYLKSVRIAKADRNRISREVKSDLRKRIGDVELTLESINDSLKSLKRSFRHILPNDFIEHYTRIVQVTNHLDEIGGIDTIVSNIESIKKQVQDNTTRLEEELDPIALLSNRSNEPLVSPSSLSSRKSDAINQLTDRIKLKIKQDLPNDEIIRKILMDLSEVRAHAITWRDLDGLLDVTIQTHNKEQLADYRHKLTEFVGRIASDYQTSTQDIVRLHLLSIRDDIKATEEDSKKIKDDLTTLRSHVNEQSSELRAVCEDLKLQVDRQVVSSPVVQEETEHMADVDRSVSYVVRNQMKAIASGLQQQSEKQMKEYRDLSNALEKLSTRVDEKSDKSNVERMIELTETTFKRQLGQNVAGLHSSVVQIVRAVEAKTDRQQVAELIADRIRELKGLLSGVLEESSELAAGSTKCLSCGRASRPISRAPVYDNIDYDGHLSRHNSPPTNSRTFATSSYPVSDDIDEFDRPRTSDRVEEKDNDKRQSDLKDLSIDEYMSKMSLQPVPRTTLQLSAPNSGRNPASRESREPLYRRARTAALVRESVKPPMYSKSSAPLQVPSSYGSPSTYLLDKEDDRYLPDIRSSQSNRR